jgi:hypothetical protein
MNNFLPKDLYLVIAVFHLRFNVSDINKKSPMSLPAYDYYSNMNRSGRYFELNQRRPASVELIDWRLKYAIMDMEFSLPNPS